MRQTLSDLLVICQNGSGKDLSTSSSTFFKQRINARDEFIVSKLPSYLNERTVTFSTKAVPQQYYHYPPQIREIEGLSITINSVIYPLTPIFSNKRWNQLNAITIQPSVIPRYYFKRQRDFGIWPIPGDAYTGTLEYSIRGGGMVRTDYTTGTVTATENDETVEGAGGVAWNTTTNILADDWFTLTDSNGEPRGSWYRIGSITDADTLELESVFEESTESAVTYKIGQCSELPEEYMELPAYFALGDYFMSFRQSPQKAQPWYNLGWTGDVGTSRGAAENSRKPWLSGGLLGLSNDYRDRDSSQLIDRKTLLRADRIWATSIS